MQVLIDILTSVFVGGILLVTTMTAMDESVRQFVNHNADAIVQNELAGMTEIVQEDLRKMGYNVPESMQQQIIQQADSASVTFLASLNGDATMDTIAYAVSPFDSVAFVDTVLVLYGVNRRVAEGGGTSSARMIGTIANPRVFRYLDQIGREVTVLQAAKMVEVTMIALNPSVYIDNAYLAAQTPAERAAALRDLVKLSFWRQTRVISKNLRR